MRMLFVGLLIVNAMIASWFYFQDKNNDQMILPMAEDLEQLVLLTEIKQKHAVTQGAVVDTSSADVEVSEASNAAVCYTMGPFKDEITLEQARTQLQEHGLNVDVRKREESQSHRYWVYLPVMSSRARATEVSRQLARAKVSDYFIVNSGEKKNAISLGYFKEKPRAENRLSWLNKRKFKAKMEVIFRLINVYWLDYSFVESSEINDELAQKYLVDGITRLDRSCDSVNKNKNK